MQIRLAGSFAALIVGIILLQFGFWRALFLLACMSIGWWVAAAFLEETDIREWLGRSIHSRHWRR